MERNRKEINIFGFLAPTTIGLMTYNHARGDSLESTTASDFECSEGPNPFNMV